MIREVTPGFCNMSINQPSTYAQTRFDLECIEPSKGLSGDRSATTLPLLARSTDVFQLRSHSEGFPARFLRCFAWVCSMVCVALGGSNRIRFPRFDDRHLSSLLELISCRENQYPANKLESGVLAKLISKRLRSTWSSNHWYSALDDAVIDQRIEVSI